MMRRLLPLPANARRKAGPRSSSLRYHGPCMTKELIGRKISSSRKGACSQGRLETDEAADFAVCRCSRKWNRYHDGKEKCTFCLTRLAGHFIPFHNYVGIITMDYLDWHLSFYTVDYGIHPGYRLLLQPWSRILLRIGRRPRENLSARLRLIFGETYPFLEAEGLQHRGRTRESA